MKKYSIPFAYFDTYPEAVVALESFCRRMKCGANIKTINGTVATGEINDDGEFILTRWARVRASHEVDETEIEV